MDLIGSGAVLRSSRDLFSREFQREKHCMGLHHSIPLVAGGCG